MKIGFIGAGTVAGTFGRHLITASHTIVVSNSRGPETLADFVADLGSSAIAGTKQLAADCEAVILATNWVKVPEALKGIDWHGRILIERRMRIWISNPISVWRELLGHAPH